MYKNVFKKRGVPNTADRHQASVFDFNEVEEEEERPCNTFKSGLDTNVCSSYFSGKSGTSGSSAFQRTGLGTQRTQFVRPQNENQVSTSGRNFKDTFFKQKLPVSRGPRIAISASRASVGQQYVRFAVVSFTMKGIEVRAAKGRDNVLSRQWPLEELCVYMCHYKLHGEPGEKAYLNLRLHKKRVFNTCDDSMCILEDDDTESLVLEVDNDEFHKKQRQVLAISDKYKNRWRRLNDDEVIEIKEKLLRSPLKEIESNVDLVSISNSGCQPERSLVPNRLNRKLEKFEVLVFPQDDPDAVTISRKDVEILRPMGFLNDTIIDFYIKYLQTKVLAKDQDRFYFFNSFFFRKLVDSGKEATNTGHGKTAYERVRKWTRKVNLFEKDYIFIPVNQSLHWSLIIICHLGNLRRSREKSRLCSSTPCILHLDSLEGSHVSIEEHIRNYLLEAWVEKSETQSGDYPEEVLSRMQYIPAQVPQQTNHCDCGLYLLHYVERFLAKAPVQFSTAPAQGFPYFVKWSLQVGVGRAAFEVSPSHICWKLSRDWFTSSEASAKRHFIQDVIFQLQQTSPSSGPADNAKSLSPIGISVPDEDGDFCISSDSDLIRSDLVVSLRKQLCGQLEASAEQPDSLDSISDVEILSATEPCDNYQHNEDSLLWEEDWWSVSSTSQHTNSSFSVDEGGQLSSTSPSRSPELLSILEIPPAVMESCSGQLKSPVVGRRGRDEEERVSTPVNKDEESDSKRPRLAITPYVVGEDTTTDVFERSLHLHKHVQCKRLSHPEESQML